MDLLEKFMFNAYAGSYYLKDAPKKSRPFFVGHRKVCVSVFQ